MTRTRITLDEHDVYGSTMHAIVTALAWSSNFDRAMRMSQGEDETLEAVHAQVSEVLAARDPHTRAMLTYACAEAQRY